MVSAFCASRHFPRRGKVSFLSGDSTAPCACKASHVNLHSDVLEPTGCFRDTQQAQLKKNGFRPILPIYFRSFGAVRPLLPALLTSERSRPRIRSGRIPLVHPASHFLVWPCHLAAHRRCLCFRSSAAGSWTVGDQVFTSKLEEDPGSQRVHPPKPPTLVLRASASPTGGTGASAHLGS